jgi:hypothetical protein
MMTPTLTFSTLDALLADSLARRLHFERITAAGLRCEICGTVWPDAEAWSRDSGVCPGASR